MKLKIYIAKFYKIEIIFKKQQNINSCTVKYEKLTKPVQEMRCMTFSALSASLSLRFSPAPAFFLGSVGTRNRSKLIETFRFWSWFCLRMHHYPFRILVFQALNCSKTIPA
jgi:hypothetical protein